MKLKLLAAMLALAAAGSAHAAIDPGTASGDGSMMANLKFVESPVVGVNNSTMATFDLGINMSTFASVANLAGVSLSWDLSTGAFTNNVSLIAPTLNYGTSFSTFNSGVDFDLNKAQLAVYGIDGTGASVGAVDLANAQQVFTTGNFVNATGTASGQTAASGPTNNDLLGIPGSTTYGNWVAAVNGLDTQATDANGANTAATGTAAFLVTDNLGKTSMFDTNGLYAGTYAAGTGILSGQAKALTMHQLYSSSVTGSHESIVKNFGFDLDGDGSIEFDNNGATAGGMNENGLWTLQGSTLSYNVAPVPEAETWAMLLAGLGMVGMIARRRKVA